MPARLSPGMAERELLRKIQQTEVLIAADPTPITLRRPRTAVSDGAGGVRPSSGNPQILPEVVRYFNGKAASYFGSLNSRAQEDPTGLGRRLSLNFVLIGLPEDDIKQNDYFIINDITWRVDFVDPASLAWQTKAEVNMVI